MTHDTPSAAKADRHGWLPIESAPKGDKVLIYFPSNFSGRMQLQEWIKVDRIPVTSPRKPTHWQPLPAPPEDT